MLKGINLVFYKKLIKWLSGFYTAKTTILILTKKKKKT